MFQTQPSEVILGVRKSAEELAIVKVVLNIEGGVCDSYLGFL